MSREDESYPCPQCQIGFLQPGRMPYVRIIRGMVVSVPDMPTYTCDVCGFQEFGSDALLLLDSLVGHAGPDSPTARSTARVAPLEHGRAHTLKP